MTEADLLAANPTRPRGATDEEARLFAEIARKMPLSEAIKGIEFRLDRDSDGDPAVWIIIFTDPDNKPSKAKIVELSRVGKAISDEIIKSDIDRWPYVRIETV